MTLNSHKMTLGMTLLLVVTPVSYAQDDNKVILDGNVHISHDLVDRGLDMSVRDVSLSATLNLSKGKLFSGVYVSNASNGTWYDAEVSFFAGIDEKLGAWDLTVMAELDSFHGGDYTIGATNFEGGSRFFPEVKATIARDYGIAYLVAGTSWSMRGRFSDAGDSVYAWFDAELPVPTMPELTIISHVGYDNKQQTLFSTGKDAVDWSVGISAFVQDYELTVSYVNSTDDRFIPNVGNRGKGRVLAGFKFYF